MDLQANLVLPCGVTGMPTTSVSWFREGVEIDQTSVLANGTLSTRVTESEASREGTNYYCVATNRIGPGNSTVATLRSRNVSVSHSCELEYTHMNMHFSSVKYSIATLIYQQQEHRVEDFVNGDFQS